MVNNYDWTKDVTFLDFAREIGKHITVNYMMAKDGVQKRLNGEGRDGLSFTEFTYQLLQRIRLFSLSIATATAVCSSAEATSGATSLPAPNSSVASLAAGRMRPHLPSHHKADGGKFGKTKSGNVWLDLKGPVPIKFYQFWLNVSDSDAEKYLKIFTFLSGEEIEALAAEHAANSGSARPMQRRLARELTVMVHSEADYDAAVAASEILFSATRPPTLSAQPRRAHAARCVFEGVPRFEIDRTELEGGIPLLDLLAVRSPGVPLQGEARKMVQQGGVSVNKVKITDPAAAVDTSALLGGKYIHIQKGKKTITF